MFPCYCEGNTVFHILTGDKHWDSLDGTKLTMEIKTHERKTKACYINRVMFCTGLVWQEITSHNIQEALCKWVKQ